MAKPDLYFLTAQRVRRCTHRVDKHFRDYCTLQFMDAGEVSLNIDDHSWAMKERWFWSCYPGPRIRFAPANETGTWSHRYVAFRGPMVERWRRYGLFPISPNPAPKSRMDFSLTFDSLLQSSMRSDNRSILRAIHLLESLLLELTEPTTEVSAQSEWLNQAATKLTESIGNEPIYFDALAASFGHSPSTFRRRFFERYGTSPNGFLLRCRIEKARKLLLETDLPLKKIAEELGYHDVYFFTRQFSRLCGSPPGAFRRSRLS